MEGAAAELKKRRIGPSLQDLIGGEEPAQSAAPASRSSTVGPQLPSSATDLELNKERLRAAEAREWEALRREKEESERRGVGREEWMTVLPEGNRQDALQFFRGGKTSFSAKGMQGKTIGEEWGAKPGEKKSRDEEEREAREEAQRAMEREKAEQLKRVVDEYNARERPKSLMEIHFEEEDGKEKKKSKREKKKKKKEGEEEEDSDSSSDEEKKKKKKRKKKKKEKKKKSKKSKKAVVTPMLGDMQVGGWDRDATMTTIVSTEKKLATIKNAGQLAGRFASGI